ncbi:ankyrin repeat family protein [Striga asiatica]|uniref:Ankyrin repeat family protein n=1 Tax=Striga asiatica TaxID=4170 RepID=A0A5A7QCD3_STRAF|nr:ankyrin repeat family protein [Striga asiatica]
MATIETPSFQEALRCDVCKCSFSTFRRRHHCRCCGRTLCAEHSSDQMALPQFGIHTNVRVCADCYNDGSRDGLFILHGIIIKDGYLDAFVPPAPNEINAVGDSISRLDISTISDAKSEVGAAKASFPGISECKCGMPLCICEAPAQPKVTAQPQARIPSITTANPPLYSIQKQKKTEPASRSRVANSSVDRASINYEVTGEGLREAIKNGDIAAAKKLLGQGVDANYSDKQGSSLLHLAAVFNHTEIAFALIDHGARLDCKNSQSETPLDCAPVTLQYRIKQKMEDVQSVAHA